MRRRILGAIVCAAVMVMALPAKARGLWLHWYELDARGQGVADLNRWQQRWSAERADLRAGRFFRLGSGEALQALDLRTRRELWRTPLQQRHGGTRSHGPLGGIFALQTGERQLSGFDAKTGQRRYDLKAASGQQLLAVELGPRGSAEPETALLRASLPDRRTARLERIDPRTGRPLWARDHAFTGPVDPARISFTPGAVSCSEPARYLLYDPRDGGPLTLEAPASGEGRPPQLTFVGDLALERSASGARLVAWAMDRKPRRLWAHDRLLPGTWLRDVTSHHVVLAHPGGDVTWLPRRSGGSRRLAAGGEVVAVDTTASVVVLLTREAIRAVDAASGAELWRRTFPHAARTTMSLAPDGRSLVVGEPTGRHELRVVSLGVADGAVRWAWQVPPEKAFADIAGLRFERHGGRLFVARTGLILD